MATPDFASQPPAPEQPKSNRTTIIIVVILVILCCCCVIGGGLGYWLWNNGDQLMGTGALLPVLAAL